MSQKRSRAAFEADLQAQQSPYVVFGTPLPPLDPDIRDDGSYVPVWKQEVTDERGRKRLHGAFTGGFSAGYYNTVGSKEGWTPATFVSSRANKKKDGAAAAPQQRPEDFMDEEDLAEAEEARRIATKGSFSGLGTTSEEVSQRAPVMDLFRASGETMGTKLLRRMGWREGQGIGPKVRRKARLSDDDNEGPGDGGQTHLFAPENSPLISLVRKNDHKGLGFEGESRLANTQNGASTARTSDDEVDDRIFSTVKKPKKTRGPRGSSFGVGILNDDGSGDEDPYQMGPRLAYNKTIGGDKKKSKKSESRQLLGNSNPLLRSKPVFIPKRLGKNKENAHARRCHDGRPPLPGFVLSAKAPTFLQEKRYPPPEIPPDWKSSKSAPVAEKTGSAAATTSTHQSNADLARASNLDPSSRAALLGETKLPGKSVFDYITPTARMRIANLTDNPALPAAGSEAPAGHDGLPEMQIPYLDSQIASSALGRGVGGFVPYTDNPGKLSRYRAFLSYHAKLSPEPPSKPQGTTRDDWVKEMQEFAHAATIFKPMSGMMANRFTSASSSSANANTNTTIETTDGKVGPPSLLSHPSSSRQRPVDTAVEAARVGMFGPMTRSSRLFYPSRLLCKRFNVPLPVVPAGGGANDRDSDERMTQAGSGNGNGNGPVDDSSASNPPNTENSTTAANNPSTGDFTSRFQSAGFQTPASSSTGKKTTELLSKEDMDALRREAGIPLYDPGKEKEGEAQDKDGLVVDPGRNDFLEKGTRPGDEVFRAIFGSDDDDDDDDG